MVRYCRWCWKSKGKPVPAVEIVDDTPVCSDCFARLGVEEEKVEQGIIDRVRRAVSGLERNRSTVGLVMQRTGLSRYHVATALAMIDKANPQPSAEPERAAPRVDPLATVKTIPEDLPAPSRPPADRNVVGIAPKLVSDDGEIRVDLLAELRKRRDALDHAIKALEIFEH